MKMEETKGSLEVARVTVCKRSEVPPNSVKHIKCKINVELPEFMVEGDENIEVLVPKTLHSKGTEAVIL